MTLIVYISICYDRGLNSGRLIAKGMLYHYTSLLWWWMYQVACIYALQASLLYYCICIQVHVHLLCNDHQYWATADLFPALLSSHSYSIMILHWVTICCTIHPPCWDSWTPWIVGSLCPIRVWDHCVPKDHCVLSVCGIIVSLRIIVSYPYVGSLCP